MAIATYYKGHVRSVRTKLIAYVPYEEYVEIQKRYPLLLRVINDGKGVYVIWDFLCNDIDWQYGFRDWSEGKEMRYEASKEGGDIPYSATELIPLGDEFGHIDIVNYQRVPIELILIMATLWDRWKRS